MQFWLCRVRTSGRPAEAPLPDTRREGMSRADLVRGVAWMRRGRTSEADVLVDTTGVACGTYRAQRRGGLCFPRPLSRVERSPAKRTSGRARRALPSRHGPKVMLRPRIDTLTDRCRRNPASPSDADLAACHASISRASEAHVFNHSQAGFRSRRLAPPTWWPKAAARQPVVKRLVNAQQNARRCDPSGGDPGGCSARPSCRGIRFRVRQP